MSFRYLALPLLFFLVAPATQADETADLRKSLPTLKGQKLIDTYGKLYMLSLETDDIDYQLKCVNDYLAETHRQGNRQEEGEARVEKITFFYNANLNDSVYEQVPQTLKFLESVGQWKNYYETWSLLINTYNFSGKTILGMDEAKKMLADAEQRKNEDRTLPRRCTLTKELLVCSVLHPSIPSFSS